MAGPAKAAAVASANSSAMKVSSAMQLLGRGRLRANSVAKGRLAGSSLAVGPYAAIHHPGLGTSNRLAGFLIWGQGLPAFPQPPLAPSIAQQVPADDQPHDLVGAFEDLMHAQVPQDALNGMVAQVAIAAMELEAAIDHLEAGIGRKPLGHGRQPRGAALAPVERIRRPVEHQSRCLELGRIVGNAEAERLEVGEPRAELLPLFHMGDGALKTELGAAERAGGDIEASAV